MWVKCEGCCKRNTPKYGSGVLVCVVFSVIYFGVLGYCTPGFSTALEVSLPYAGIINGDLRIIAKYLQNMREIMKISLHSFIPRVKMLGLQLGMARAAHKAGRKSLAQGMGTVTLKGPFLPLFPLSLSLDPSLSLALSRCNSGGVLRCHRIRQRRS